MIRSAARKYTTGLNPDFRNRGEEPGRLENFSDAVFGMAITLLLISTSPPSNFDQIRRFVYDLIPFSLCIILIVLIWYQHFIFFLRYGLRDTTVIVLNTLFLVIVLFYVYPLKFLTRLVLIPIASITGNESLRSEMIGTVTSNTDWADLMIIYGAGGAATFLVLYFMYRYALKRSADLELTEIEEFDTRVSARTNLLMAIVPLISVVVAIFLRGSWMAGLFGGFVYMLYTPIMMTHGKRADRQRAVLLKKIETSRTAPVKGGTLSP